MKKTALAFLSRASALLLAALLTLPLLTPAARAAQERERLRVGFFAFDGYHMMDEQGVRSGYGYEFLRLAARYIDVDYEYVGYENGWDDMLDMLARGEIDLVTSVQKTEERLEKFAFSKPIGTSSAMLTVDSRNFSVVAGDYHTYNGLRIGLLEGNSRNEDIARFAKAKDFSYTPVYFSLSTELEEALFSGKIDAALTSSLRETQGERVLDIFSAEEFYAVVRKEDTRLLAQLNYAIDQLNATEGDWKNDLSNTYYDHLEERDLSFTPAEQALLRQYASGEKTLVVSACTDKKPYAYSENGEAKGILFDYFARLADYVGIPYTVITPADREEYIAWCDSGLVEVCLDGRFQSAHQAEQLGRTPSASYATMRLAMVTRRDFDGEIETLAVSDAQGLFGIEDGLAPHAARLSVDSREEAMEAVLDGAADATFVYLYTAQQFVNRDERGLLTYTMLTEPTYEYHLSFGESVSHELVGIFTKAIYAMPDGLFEEIASQHTSYKAEDVDLLTWIEIYPLPTLFFSAVLFLAITVAIVLSLREKAARLEKQRALELHAITEEKERATRAKSDFLANVSHDLRTPMNAIVGVANLMEREPDLSEKQRDYVQKLQASSNHLLGLIDDVLDMRQLEAETIALRPETLSLTKLLHQIESIMQSEADARRQTLTVTFLHLQHDTVLLDGGRMRQVLLNLLSNAVKYTQDGGSIDLSLEERPCAAEGKRLFCFSVSDNGCGMTPELVARLFDPFVRGEASVTNKIQGAGLGMAITKNIVNVMDGEINVESAVGQGTCIAVMLELPVLTEEEALRGRHFLCAEDNALNAEILVETLAVCGASCTVCADGEEVLETFAASAPEEYDAILMDIQMPRMDGLAAARAIRALSLPHAGSIPIIAMSANSSADDAARSLAAGMNAHLTKPVSVAALRGEVRRLCGEK